MKKILTLLLALMAILPASADSYFTIGVNDTVRIRPMYLGAQILSDVQVYLDGRIDHWSLDISYPTDLDFSAADVDGNGVVGISDLSELTDMLS